MMEQLKDALEYILTPSPAVFIVGGLIVLLVPILVHIFVERATPYTALPSILLVGPAGGGKTSLQTLLERGGDGHAPATHTSQTPQPVELTVSRDGMSILPFRESARDDAPGSHKKFLLVDTPGHGKLRNHAMDRIAGAISKASGNSKKQSSDGAGPVRGIVFVVDAAALDDGDGGLAAAAAYLYDVLMALQRRAGAGRTSRAPSAIHVLVAANKLDLFTALPASLVRSNLEAELGRIRQSRSKGLLDSGVGIDDIGSEEQDAWLGQYGSDKFTFGQMREFDIEVDVIGGSVLEGKVDKWWDWIAKRI
ncbi:hypothetical protein DL769_006735 [Monosporascus sp. CRB-8-3]|nr:hypothetical protein DL769_006735 [Monosporascus sp. CRB-8-3]